MKQFNKIVIIGVGLIGGSIGLAIKKLKLAKTVVGIARRESSARQAKRIGAVDSATLSYKKGLENADLVIIATPIGRIIDIVKNVIKAVPKDKRLLLTDVGSTKEFIVREIEKIIPKNIKFIGSHPMAGSEKSGVKSASGNLFDKSLCIITNTKNTDKEALKKIKHFWKAIGLRSRILAPSQHDKLISFISHLPHIVSCALTLSAIPESLEFASTGFKDMTRIAAADPGLWQDIFVTNKWALFEAIYEYKKALERIENSIKKKDLRLLYEMLNKAKRIRVSLK